MGSGRWDNTAYNAASALRAATGTSAFAYTDSTLRGVPRSQWKAHASLDPSGVTVRESRDSTEHPESLAIAVLFDITGSMHRVPRVLQGALDKFFDSLLQSNYVEHPQVMFGAIGDYNAGDPAPLQIGQFESDNRVEHDLGNIALVGGGGDGRQESYELALYFMARHTSIDCFEKRNHKGYLFIIGDEKAYPKVDTAALRDVLDVPSQDAPTLEEVVAECQEKYNVYFVIPAGSVNYANPEIHSFWKKLLGDDHFLVMPDPTDVCDVIGLTIAKNEAQTGLAGMTGTPVVRCSCAYIRVGSERTTSRNWNPECVEHGLDSTWYNSDEQKKKRSEQSSRLRDLQAKARELRKKSADGV